METGDLEPYEEVPAVNFDLAWEAVLPLMIERIEQDGQSLQFSEAWRDELDPADSDKVEAVILNMKLAAQAAGEKNPGAIAAAS